MVESRILPLSRTATIIAHFCFVLKEEENYDFDDEVIAKRLEDVHIRRSLATTYSFDQSFKTKIDAEVEQLINQERTRHPSSWSDEPYNADLTRHEIVAGWWLTPQ